MGIKDDNTRRKPEQLPKWAETDLFVKEMCLADLAYRHAVCNAKTEEEIRRLKEYALFKT